LSASNHYVPGGMRPACMRQMPSTSRGETGPTCRMVPSRVSTRTDHGLRKPAVVATRSSMPSSSKHRAWRSASQATCGLLPKAAQSRSVTSISHHPLQRTPAATEAMVLLMKHAFELGYRRCEWKCDALNAPSRAAAQRLGLSFEGIFRQATVVKGRNRDTAWYSVIDKEWPALAVAFSRWLDPANFDAAGHQRVSLSAITRAVGSEAGTWHARDDSNVRPLPSEGGKDRPMQSCAFHKILIDRK
jgi:hypothetical protein